jgi:hypothetical protein
MEALEASMKKHNINIDSSSSSHGHSLSAYGFSLNPTSTSSSDEWLIDSGALMIWLRIKSSFLLLMNVTPNKYLLAMINLLVL